MNELKINDLISGQMRDDFNELCSRIGDKAKTQIIIISLTKKWFISVGEDAKLISKQIHGDDDFLKYDELIRLNYILLENRQLETILRTLLIIKQYSVDLYQYENKQFINKFSGSPGNLIQFEDILFRRNNKIVQNNCIVAVRLSSSNEISLTVIDLNEFIISFHVFIDNEFASSFERILVQSNPKECLLFNEEVKNSIRFELLKNILDRNSVMIIYLSKEHDEFNEKEFKKQIEKNLIEKHFNIIEKKFEITFKCLQCLHALAMYLNLLENEFYFNKFQIVKIDFSQSVFLNGSAIKALNLLPDNESCDILNTKRRNLFDLLNNCCTIQGKRLLEQWIRQPLLDWKKINDRLNCVEELAQSTEFIDELRGGHFNSLSDFLDMVHKIYRKNSKAKHLYRMYQSIQQIKSVLKCIGNFNSLTHIDKFIVKPCNNLLKDLKKFETLIEDNIDMDMVERGEYIISSKKNNDLVSLKEQLITIEEKAGSEFDMIMNKFNDEFSRFVKIDSSDTTYRYSLRVPNKREAILHTESAKKLNLKIIDSKKNCIYVVTDKLVELSEKHKNIMKEYEEKQEEMLLKILDCCLQYCPTFLLLNSLISKYDVLLSFAYSSVSASKRYVRPTILIDENDENLKSNSIRFTEKRYMKIIQARHPCMEIQTNISFIPNDVEFEENSDLLHIITGPNMGGKSTYIRTIGVICLMMQIGCFVPCESAEIPIFDSIFARIGSSDSFSKGLSTFVVEMAETASILKNCTSKSLVIIDELCRGTSTHEGISLAWAIGTQIVCDKKPFALFATHFQELTDLSNNYDTVKNFYTSFKIENDTLFFTYTIQPGFVDCSFGVHVAKMVGLPKEVIEDATKIQKELELVPEESLMETTDSQSLSILSEKRHQYVLKGIRLLDEFTNRVKKLIEDKKNIQIKNISNMTDYITDDIKPEIMQLQKAMNLDSNQFLKQFGKK